MTPFQKILQSSTAWFGGIATAIGAFSQTTGWAIPTPITAALIAAYGIKEAASKIGESLKTPPIVSETQNQKGT
jgi:hypothetical protein